MQLPFMGKPTTHFLEKRRFLDTYSIKDELETAIKEDERKEFKKSPKLEGQTVIWHSYNKSDHSTIIVRNNILFQKTCCGK